MIKVWEKAKEWEEKHKQTEHSSFRKGSHKYYFQMIIKEYILGLRRINTSKNKNDQTDLSEWEYRQI